MLISFSGHMSESTGTGAFEFGRITQDIPVRKLFLKDPSALWYCKGIPGVGENFEEIAGYIKGICAAQNVKRIVTIGNSAGAYAAILFGILIGADEIHAFGPQTRLLSPSDSGSEGKIDRIPQNIDPSYLDLREMAIRHQSKSKIFVYYDWKEQRDKRHAYHLRGLENVRLVQFLIGGHAVASMLKESGQLKGLLTTALLGSSDGKNRRKTPKISLQSQGMWYCKSFKRYAVRSGSTLKPIRWADIMDNELRTFSSWLPARYQKT
jgi:hypothetical protein